MTRLAEMKEPLNPNGFGTTWLGNLVEDLGVDFQNMEEALVLVKEHNDDPDNENDNIWVHKFETVD